MIRLDELLARCCDTVLLKTMMEKMRPDWVLGVLKESAIKAVTLGKTYHCRVANFVYECPPWFEEIVGREHFQHKYVGYVKSLWEKTREAYLSSDVLFPNSDMARDYVSSWLDGKWVADPIYPGVDEQQMPVEHELENGKSSRAAKVLYVGRLTKRKNVDHLVEAFSSLKMPAQLHICGDGPEKKRLMAMTKEMSNVFFHGFVSDDELWSQYRYCDLVVLPSSFEGFGMSPMQALYYAKACLVSDIPIFRSIYGNHLEYFPLGDVNRLAFMLEELLTDREYRARRGKEGREYILSRFTWAGAAREIERTLVTFSQGDTSSR